MLVLGQDQSYIDEKLIEDKLDRLIEEGYEPVFTGTLSNETKISEIRIGALLIKHEHSDSFSNVIVEIMNKVEVKMSNSNCLNKALKYLGDYNRADRISSEIIDYLNS